MISQAQPSASPDPTKTGYAAMMKGTANAVLSFDLKDMRLLHRSLSGRMSVGV
jgi:hypothetical protein